MTFDALIARQGQLAGRQKLESKAARRSGRGQGSAFTTLTTIDHRVGNRGRGRPPSAVIAIVLRAYGLWPLMSKNESTRAQRIS